MLVLNCGKIYITIFTIVNDKVNNRAYKLRYVSLDMRFRVDVIGMCMLQKWWGREGRILSWSSLCQVAKGSLVVNGLGRTQTSSGQTLTV